MFRLSYFDLALRSLGDVDVEALARAIERLSRSYRQGCSIEHERAPLARAAYLVHVLPAHACDVRRLLLDEAQDVLEREEVSALALGGGPGTEVLALAEAVARLPEPRVVRRVRVRRADRVAAWDEAFGPLEREAREALSGLDAGLGTGWTLDAPPRSIVADLASAPSPEVLEAARDASLVIVANVLTELPPRGTPRPPDGFLEAIRALARVAPAGQDVLLLDRAHAPGAIPRLEAALAALVLARPATRATAPRVRETRCACALTRAVKALYARVRLETTRHEDKPILTTRTAWARATLG